jgi:integrase
MNGFEVSGSVFLVKRVKDDVWFAKLRINGEQKKVRLGPAHTGRDRVLPGSLTENMAKVKLEALKTEARRGNVAIQHRTDLTLGEVIDAWVAYLGEKGRKDTYLMDLRGIVKRSILAFFGESCPLERVTHDRCNEFSRSLTARGLAPGTCRRYLMALSGICKYAVRFCGLSINPMLNVDLPVQKNSLDFNVLSAPEVEKLAAHAPTLMYSSLFLTAGFCGLRQGELRGLRWRDISWDEDSILVMQNVPGRTSIVSTPKSGKPRSVPMPSQVVNDLRKWRVQSEFVGPDDPVFTLTGGYFSITAIGKAFHKALKSAGLKRIRFHDMRHSCATMLTRGFDPFEVMEIMGHASLTTTQRYYHYRPQNDRAAKLSTMIANAS